MAESECIQAEIEQSYLTRMSLRELQRPENKLQRFSFLKAWDKIKKLPPTDPFSFWTIAGYHGEPFAKREVPPLEVSNSWDGYCQHANVLFPVWHRFYVLRIEQALQYVSPGENVAMHYWDQTSAATLKFGIPDLLMDETVEIDESGTTIPNPLLNYTFQEAISSDKGDTYYDKPLGYTTVRYPLSGIKSPPGAEVIANQHNKNMKSIYDETQLNEVLNENVITAIKVQAFGEEKTPIQVLYEKCLEVKDYNIFSNTSSAGHYDEGVALEDPHNQIHLAVGGFDLPKQGQAGLIRGANGDMGENETAAFDPIFFFHHCNVDRVFWLWQQRQGHTQNLTIDDSNPLDPGITPLNGQGPTPYQTPTQLLNMDTPLHPFKVANGDVATGNGCINIKDLGYTYSPGSLEMKTSFDQFRPIKYDRIEDMKDDDSIEPYIRMAKEKVISRTFFNLKNIIDKDGWQMKLLSRYGHKHTYVLKVENIKRDKYPGSFLVIAHFRKTDGSRIYVGRTAVLDRWERKDCGNCQLHRDATATFTLDPEFLAKPLSLNDYDIEIAYKSAKTAETQLDCYNLGSIEKECGKPSLFLVVEH